MKRAYGSGESASLQALAKAHLLPYLSHALLLVNIQRVKQQVRPGKQVKEIKAVVITIRKPYYSILGSIGDSFIQ